MCWCLLLHQQLRTLSFFVVNENLLWYLIACLSKVNLVEWLRRIELVAVLSANHVCVQVLLSLPCRSVEEIHGCCETTCSYMTLALGRQFKRVVKVHVVHVWDLLAKVGSWLESWVGEGLSGCGGWSSVPQTRMGHWESPFTIAIVDGLQSGICFGDLLCVETREFVLLTAILLMIMSITLEVMNYSIT